MESFQNLQEAGNRGPLMSLLITTSALERALGDVRFYFLLLSKYCTVGYYYFQYVWSTKSRLLWFFNLKDNVGAIIWQSFYSCPIVPTTPQSYKILYITSTLEEPSIPETKGFHQVNLNYSKHILMPGERNKLNHLDIKKTGVYLIEVCEACRKVS